MGADSNSIMIGTSSLVPCTSDDNQTIQLMTAHLEEQDQNSCLPDTCTPGGHGGRWIR